MKLIKITLWLFFTFVALAHTRAQSLTLEVCQEWAAKHYPAIARYNIIAQTAKYNVATANTAYFPQLSLTAKATYQSDVTQLPISLPNIKIPPLDKEQYQVVVELTQLIWDGGQIEAKKAQIKANAEMKQQQLQSETYALRERVNGVFFGILLLKKQLTQQSLLEKELQRNYEKIQSYIDNGVANQTDISAVKVQQLKAKQRRIQMKTALKAYIQTLSVLTGKEIDEQTLFIKPHLKRALPSPVILRPELKLFDAQQNLIRLKRKVLEAKNMPMIGVFAQGGYGKPGLNFFSNNLSSFFIGGIRLSWNISNLYTLKNEKQNIELQKMLLNTKRETFLYNLNTQIPQQQLEIEKYRTTMKDDDEIIRNQQIIKEAAEAKMENGTMTVANFLQEINALELTKQTKSLHEIQYLMAIYTLKNTTNN